MSVHFEIMGWDRLTPNRILLSTLRYPEWVIVPVLNPALETLQRQHLLVHPPGGRSIQARAALTGR